MEINNEILCIPGKTKNYAVEFVYIKEICSDILVSKVPCLPEYFMGVFHYQGAIIPVISLETEQEAVKTDNRSIVLVLEYQKYQLGIQLFSDPYMVQAKDMTWIDMPEQEEEGSDIWAGKAFCNYRDTLFSLGDIEKLMEHLMIYHAN